MPEWEMVLKFINELGWFEGLTSILILILHSWIFWLYRGRLNDRQKEIDRVAADNREYRDKFIQLMDRRFGLTEKDKTQ